MMSNLFYNGWGVGRGPICLSKRKLKNIWAGSFFPGVGVHLLIPMESYTSYDFPCQESLSSPPLWMIGSIQVNMDRG